MNKEIRMRLRPFYGRIELRNENTSFIAVKCDEI